MAVFVTDVITIKFCKTWQVLKGPYKPRTFRFTAVISGVPQGSILTRLLFIIFINDLDDGVVNKILKFADDRKIVSKVASEDQIKI